MHSTIDRPPVGQFLLMFLALLAAVVGLAALSQAPETTAADAAPDQHVAATTATPQADTRGR